MRQTNAGGGDRAAVLDRTVPILRAKKTQRSRRQCGRWHTMSAGRDRAVATASVTVTTVSDRRPSAVAASMPPSSGGGDRTDDEY